MTRQITREGTPEVEVPQVVTSTELEVFRPSKAMKKLKAEFYAKISGHLVDLNSLSIEQVRHYISDRRLPGWWENPEFTLWFTNAKEYSQRIEYLLALQLDNLQEIIEDDAEVYSTKDKIAAGKQLMEFRETIRGEGKSSGEVTDEEKRRIAEMVQARLDARKADTIKVIKLPT